MTEISEGKDALFVDRGHVENLVAKGQRGRARLEMEIITSVRVFEK